MELFFKPLLFTRLQSMNQETNESLSTIETQTLLYHIPQTLAKN